MFMSLTLRQETCLIANVSRLRCLWDGIELRRKMEGAMTAKDVKQTLKDEADLLDHMIKAVKSFDNSGFNGQAKFIQNSWAEFLGDRCRTNRSLQEADDYELVIDLTEEKCQVEQYVKATNSTAGYTETWDKFLTCERDILEKLVEKARNGKSAQ
ncbi:MAG: hypothetical protein ABJM26_07440 [Anderseniella sp.]